MFNTREHKGTWWLAGDSEKKLPGVLTVTKGDAELEVLGHFGGTPPPGPGESVQISDWMRPGDPRRIVGLTTEKEHVTLEGALVDSFPGDISTYDPPWALVGKAFAEDEEISFDEIVVQFSDLDTWTRRSGFNHATREPNLPEARLAGTFDIEFERPPNVEIALDNGEVASIEFSVVHSGWGSEPTSVTVSQTAFFRLRFAERHSLNALARRVGQLRNFFTLAVGRPVSVISVTAYQNDYRRSGSERAVPIRLLWEIPHNPDPPSAARHPIKMAFTLPECPNGISEVMKTWFRMQELFAPVFILFFAVGYHPDLYAELRFLSYAQAIESYDRRRRNTGSAIDQRLRATMKLCPTVRTNLLKAAGVTLDEFLSSFADSRNYYTHYTSGPQENSQATRGALLYALTVHLQAVIEMVLLNQLGFSDTQIDEIFKTRIQRYREITNAKAYASDEDLVVPQE